MEYPTTATLINSQSRELAFKLYELQDENMFDHISRFSYFTVLWIREGEGRLRVDDAEYSFNADTMMFFSPYQPFVILADGILKMSVLHFHSDFFCIFKHKNEVPCNNVLFNNIYQPPFISLSKDTRDRFDEIIACIANEMKRHDLDQVELIISYLKILLINASRIMIEQNPAAMNINKDQKQPFLIQNLQQKIETHFKISHSPAAYAEMLNISAKALNRITKTHFNRTLSNLIHERIIIEAKRELYLSAKTVKEISGELGFSDEFHFSKFFKKKAGISPVVYRQLVGFNRESS